MNKKVCFIHGEATRTKDEKTKDVEGHMTEEAKSNFHFLARCSKKHSSDCPDEMSETFKFT